MAALGAAGGCDQVQDIPPEHFSYGRSDSDDPSLMDPKTGRVHSQLTKQVSPPVSNKSQAGTTSRSLHPNACTATKPSPPIQNVSNLVLSENDAPLRRENLTLSKLRRKRNGRRTGRIRSSRRFVVRQKKPRKQLPLSLHMLQPPQSSRRNPLLISQSERRRICTPSSPSR